MVEGFFELIPRKKPEPVKEKEPEKKKPKKRIEVKFKKGSWKYYLQKKIKEWKSGKFCEDFHFTMLSNMIVCAGDTPVVIVQKTRFKRKKLEKLDKKYGKDCYVLINAMDNVYVKISVESYLKLMDVDKIALSYKLQGNYDDTEISDVYENEMIIDNINDLVRFINFHRQAIEGIYEMQAACCSFTTYDWKFKMVVMKRNGECETYKSDMNDFMKAYGLYQF